MAGGHEHNLTQIVTTFIQVLQQFWGVLPNISRITRALSPMYLSTIALATTLKQARRPLFEQLTSIGSSHLQKSCVDVAGKSPCQ
jgi:hypothetical protein